MTPTTDQAAPPDAPPGTHVRWVRHRRGLSVVCTTKPRPDGRFDVVLTLMGVTVEREIVRSVPGNEEQVTSWRQQYEAFGFCEEPSGAVRLPMAPSSARKCTEA